MAGPGPALRVVGDHRGTALPSSVQPHTWDRERFPVITDLEIVGDHPEAIGVQLQNTMQATVSRVLVRRCKYAVHLVERNRNFVLSDSHLYDNAEFGLFLDRCNLHQINVTGNHISYCKKAGVKVLNGDVHNLQITGNDIEYNNHPGVDASPNGEPRGAEVWFECPDGTVSEVTVASNTLQATVQPGGANVRIHGNPRGFPSGARLVTITGNVLGSQRRGIELKHVQRVSISGNTLYDAQELTLWASHCEGITLAANTVSGGGTWSEPPRDGFHLEDCANGVISGLTAERLGAGTPERGAAITLVRCRDVTVTDCQILDAEARGIELEGCERCRVTGNTVIDRRLRPTVRQAVRVLGPGKNNLVTNNLVGGATERAIVIAPGTALDQGNTELS
jgi:parallel beta-helix repeat protein